MNFLDKLHHKALLWELNRIAPQYAQNKFGTKIIDPKQQEIFMHIARVSFMELLQLLINIGVITWLFALTWKTL